MPQEKLFMKNLDRFDLYIASIDRKAAFIVSFNTFVLGTLLFKYNDILCLFYCAKIKTLVSFLLVLGLIAVIFSIFSAFNATKPFLQSGNKTGEYTSLLFFNTVAEMNQDTYLNNVLNLSAEDFQKDIAYQTHTLAQGLKEKFRWIRISKNTTLWGTILSLEISTILLVVDYWLKG